MSLNIIVPCWNHWKTTANCLVSIFKSKIPIPYQVTVINDNSTDYTKSLLEIVIKEGYPISVITNSFNKGYVSSVNEALKINNSEFILFMNNDVILDKDCILNLLESYQKYPRVGVLGATQLDSNREESSPLKYFLRGEKATIRDHIICTNIPKSLKESD
jgi:hypothetical protein